MGRKSLKNLGILVLRQVHYLVFLHLIYRLISSEVLIFLMTKYAQNP